MPLGAFLEFNFFFLTRLECLFCYFQRTIVTQIWKFEQIVNMRLARFKNAKCYAIGTKIGTENQILCIIGT
jgi:hypothetical protein